MFDQNESLSLTRPDFNWVWYFVQLNPAITNVKRSIYFTHDWHIFVIATLENNDLEALQISNWLYTYFYYSWIRQSGFNCMPFIILFGKLLLCGSAAVSAVAAVGQCGSAAFRNRQHVVGAHFLVSLNAWRIYEFRFCRVVAGVCGVW